MVRKRSAEQVRSVAPLNVVVLVETLLGAPAVSETARVDNTVAVIGAGYTPTGAQVRWARMVLDVARSERGVFQFDGQMVDMPVLRRARRIVALVPEC